MEGEQLVGDLVAFLAWFLSPSSHEKHNDPSPDDGQEGQWHHWIDSVSLRLGTSL